MPIPAVLEMLKKIEEIHTRKGRDYAAAENPFENFERSATVTSWFKFEEDKVFATFISTKLARLATLLNSGAKPNNESIDDSFLDLATYCILWYAAYKDSEQI